MFFGSTSVDNDHVFLTGHHRVQFLSRNPGCISIMLDHLSERLRRHVNTLKDLVIGLPPGGIPTLQNANISVPQLFETQSGLLRHAVTFVD